MASKSKSDLEKLVEEYKQQIEYYKNLARQAGNKRLRETEELSGLIKRLRKTESALEKARDELEKRVAERTAELLKTNELLKQEIAEREQAALELAESENKYKKLFEDSLEAMSLTQSGKIIDVNPAWLKLHGFKKKSEVIGMKIDDIIHPDDKNILLERRKNWPKIDERIYPVRDKRKNGTSIDVEVYSSGITLKGERAILATIRDKTKQNLAEAERKYLEEKLHHSEKMEAIGELAGGVAHDLNNILGGIVSYPDLILLDIPENSPLREPILTMQRSGRKAAAIVQDLLTLARRGVPIKKIINLNNIIDEYIKSAEYLKLMSFHKKIELVTSLEDDLLNIEGSPVHIFKTIMNLVSNAAEALAHGGEIRISTANKFFKKSSKKRRIPTQGEYVMLKVTDNGSGIAQEDLRRIFEPFYSKKVMGRSGTGLGMAVVWGTVQDHEGLINVESKEGKGTTFTIYLPASREELIQKEQDGSIKDILGKGELILVVDDVEEQRIIASQVLTKIGYKVKTVASGEEAIKYVKNHAPALIILDMIMEPGIDGLETYKKILKYHPQQKALLVSGFSETELVRTAQELGAGIYIRKPYTLQKIGKAIKYALNRK